MDTKFYTPQNQFFYSQAPYTPLDSKRCQIRVIRVFPRTTVREHFRNHPEWDRNYVKELDAELQLLACQIEATALASIAGDYSTISYSAGDLADTKLILVNGVPFNAFANLEHAIECILAHWSRTGHRPSNSYKLWADQICINQSDRKELGEQVQFMREVYRQSEQTLVCLSTPKVLDCLSWVPRVTEVANMSQSGDTPGVTVLKNLLLDFLVGTGEGGTLRPSLTQLPTRRKSHSPGYYQIRTNRNNVRRANTTNNSSSRAFPPSQRHTLNICVGLDSFDDPPSAEAFQNSLWNFMANKWWRRQILGLPRVHLRELNTIRVWPHVGKEDEKKAEVLRREREEERDRQESELRRRQEEEAKRMKKEEQRRKELEDRKRRLSEQLRQQRILEAEKEAERVYQQRREEYHSQILAFDKERKRQWEAARKEQSNRRERYVAEERMKVEDELNDVRSRVAAVKLESWNYVQQKWELHQEEKVLLNFWKEVLSKSIEDQIKTAWSFRKDIVQDQDLKINKKCGGRLFSRDRIEALIGLDRIANTPKEFTPVGVKQPVLPRKPTPTRRGEFGGKRPFASTPTVATVEELPQRRRPPYLAPPLTPRGVSHFSYLREDSDNSFGEEEHTADHISAQGHQGAGGSKSREAETSMELSLEKLDPFEVRQRNNIISFQTEFRQFDQSAIRSMVKGKQTFKRSSELKSLLQHSRSCEASDARDRVYAFLGLAHQGYDIIPNYAVENGVRDVLIETAKSIIRFDKSLDILRHVHRGRDKLGLNLPSWVPDWTSEETQTGLDECSWEEANPFDASKGLPADVQFSSATGDDDHQDLKVRGIFIDKIEDARSESSDPGGLCSFLTKKDNLKVIGPRSARIDDEVWVLYGSKKPVVLRPNSNTSSAYGYLGDVLVYGKDASFSRVMFGEVVEKMQQVTSDKTRERELWII
ncbi:heterokaryon incompatibility protein-domain-containing protein [Xylaria cf. heliscus]|nr:heterokaryon incompatibility protein-domain-containing protein [Xylaria cf. heliscus]